jgi:hypothetical protein
MLGAIYLAGYVVECKLKTLLGRMRRPFPTSGRGGHDLRALWDAAGLRSADVRGFRRAFMDYWNTGIRYSARVDSEHSPQDLLRGAMELSSYVSGRIPYAGKRRNGAYR